MVISCAYLERHAFEDTVVRGERVRKLNILEVIRLAAQRRTLVLVVLGPPNGWLKATNPEEVIGCRVGLGEACAKWLGGCLTARRALTYCSQS